MWKLLVNEYLGDFGRDISTCLAARRASTFRAFIIVGGGGRPAKMTALLKLSRDFLRQSSAAAGRPPLSSRPPPRRRAPARRRPRAPEWRAQQALAACSRGSVASPRPPHSAALFRAMAKAKSAGAFSGLELPASRKFHDAAECPRPRRSQTIINAETTMADCASFRRDGEPPTLLDSHTQASDEVGYLFLENGDVKVPSDGEIKGTPTRTWIDVECETPPDFHARNTVAADPSAQAGNDCVEGSLCSRCNLVLLPIRDESDGAVNRLVLKNAPRFDGTLADLICGSSCTNHRSDAALLAGVAFTCQEYGYVAIRSIKVLFFDNRYEKISCVITIAMPALTREGQNGKRSIIPTTNGSARKKNVTKPLPPSVQLLLTIVKSDWNFLDKQMTRLEQAPTMENNSTLSDFVLQMESDGSLKKSRRTIFPPKLSLEELYLRLRGVSTSELDSESEASSSLLVSLPRELVVTFIAPFLPACSLDALRQSCKLFHHCMRSVVPGMKLRLYAHQIRSLEWMRRRETKELSEEEVLNNESNLFGEECVSGDMHRAVTGGASTCLRLRGTREVFRINQQTGNEIAYTANESKKGFALSRRISRGGLLCDDPGLGKTITSLSLILQTCGLSTLPADKSSPKVGSALSHTDDDIFQAYWNDHVPFVYRRGSFMKIINTLGKQNADIGLFERPVDPVRDRCPDYLDIIDRPISICEIKKLINEGYTFQEFQEDVGRCFRFVNRLACISRPTWNYLNFLFTI